MFMRIYSILHVDERVSKIIHFSNADVWRLSKFSLQ